MDPVSILTIITTSANIVKSINSLIQGEQGSYDKLQELADRLKSVQRLATQLELTGSAEGIEFPSVTEALLDCKNFLDSYKHGIPTQSRFRKHVQRFALGTIDSERLEEVHRRIDRASRTLQETLQALRDGAVAQGSTKPERRSSWDSSALAGAAMNSRARGKRNASTQGLPDRTFSGTTFVGSDDGQQHFQQDGSTGSDYHPTNPWHPSHHRQYAASSASYSSTLAERLAVVEEPEDEEGGYSAATEFAVTTDNERELAELSYQGYDQEVRLPATDLGPLALPETSENTERQAPYSEQGEFYACGDVKIELVKKTEDREHETMHFSGGYNIEDVKGRRVVEWTDGTNTVWHHIPVDYRGIPHTRPNKPKLDFLPPSPQSCKSWVSIRRDAQSQYPEGDWMNPRYSFALIEDRDTFQRAIRRCASLTAFVAQSIETLEGSKSLSMDVELKLWAPLGEAEPARISFARNLIEGDKKKHDEYQIDWFLPLKEATSSSKRAVYELAVVPNTDGSHSSKRPRSGSHGRHSLSSSPRVLPSRRTSVESTAASISGAGGDGIPHSLRRDRGFRVKFSKAEGDAFAQTWTTALQGVNIDFPAAEIPPSLSNFSLGGQASRSYQGSLRSQPASQGQRSPLSTSPFLSPMDYPATQQGHMFGWDTGYMQQHPP